MYLSPESPFVKDAQIESTKIKEPTTTPSTLETSLESERDLVLSYLGME
jgi:hypothetical protein